MANQVALRALCPPGTLAVAGRRQHVVVYEAAAAAANAGIQIHPVDDTDGTLSVADVALGHRRRLAPLPRARARVHRADPHALGRRALEPRRLEAVVAAARDLPVHMDGARLFNAEVATGVDAAALRRPR